MTWDQRQRQSYEKEVLEEARRRQRVPSDLFKRYGIDDRLKRELRSDPQAFSAHVAEVDRYWKSKQRGVLKKITRDLSAAHDQLRRAGRLTFDHFERTSRAAAEQARQELSDLVRNFTTSHIDHATLRSLAETVSAPNEEIEKALHGAGIRVVELPELPCDPPTRSFRSLRESLTTRGADFSPDVVFGEERVRAGFRVLDGFRLADGDRVDDAALSAAAERVEVEAHTDRKTAADKVISILRAARDQDVRDAVILWEIVSDLRGMPGNVAERGLARRWTRRGLDEDEAGRIAAAVRQGGPPDPTAQAETEVRDLLGEGRLRAAARAVATLSGDHELHTRVRTLSEQVNELSRSASAHLSAGRPDDAAHALSSAMELAVDDEELAGRLVEIPPLRAGNVRARVNGRKAVVSWSRSPSQIGGITYRVVRQTGQSGIDTETKLAHVDGTEIVDEQVPVGTEIRYSVVATRANQAEAPPAVTNVLMVTPDISDVTLSTTRFGVVAHWSRPCEATRVEVLRGEGRPENVEDGVPVEASETGFRDTDVRTGTRYYYRIRAVYLTPAGRTRRSTGVIRSVVVTSPPSPVLDLDVDPWPAAGGTFTASWSPPEHGEVVLRLGPDRPTWRPGARVGVTDVETFGPELPRTEEVMDDHARLEFTAPSGRNHVLVTTVSGDQVAIGSHAEVVNTEPVRAVRAERLDSVVRLRWTWPERASSVLVDWSTADNDTARAQTGTENETADADTPTKTGAERAKRCTRRQYEDEGGFEAEIGDGTATVRVTAIVTTPQGELFSAPVLLTVVGTSVVDYRVRPSGLLRWHRRVELSTHAACDIPEIAVAFFPGLVQPYSLQQDGIEVLARIPAQRLTPGTPVSVDVTPPRGSGPAWLMCFADREGDTTAVRLRQPSVRELKIR